MKYMVLRPQWYRTGEIERMPDGKVIHYEAPNWIKVGPAESAEDAKRRYKPVEYGYALVMEES